MGGQVLEAAGRRIARKYALLGVGVFLLGFLLGAVGSVFGLEPIVPFADVLVLLGFVLSVYGLVLAAGPPTQIVVVGALYGLGEFYKGQDHGTHIASGIGFGLPHPLHILMGLLIMTSATVLTAALAYYHT